jgi:hypothetical protein
MFYWTRRLLAMFARAHHFSLPYARWVHTMPPRLIALWSVLKSIYNPNKLSWRTFQIDTIPDLIPHRNCLWVITFVRSWGFLALYLEDIQTLTDYFHCLFHGKKYKFLVVQCCPCRTLPRVISLNQTCVVITVHWTTEIDTRNKYRIFMQKLYEIWSLTMSHVWIINATY